MGACGSCLWPLYAKLGISHSQAGCDRPEVREINARLGHFIIVILFFQTLPLTFNFAPELIVCSLQYDWWRRIRVAQAPGSGLDSLWPGAGCIVCGQSRGQTGSSQRISPHLPAAFRSGQRSLYAQKHPFASRDPNDMVSPACCGLYLELRTWLVSQLLPTPQLPRALLSSFLSGFGQ